MAKDKNKCPPVSDARFKTWVIIVLVIALAFITFRPGDAPDLILPADSISDINIHSRVADYVADEYESSNVEFMACLTGEIADGVVTVDNLFFPEQRATINNVEGIYCYRPDTVGIIHSHLSDDCTFSKDDIYSFGKIGLPVLGVICSSGDINFINSDIENINVRII